MNISQYDIYQAYKEDYKIVLKIQREKEKIKEKEREEENKNVKSKKVRIYLNIYLIKISKNLFFILFITKLSLPQCPRQESFLKFEWLKK